MPCCNPKCRRRCSCCLPGVTVPNTNIPNVGVIRGAGFPTSVVQGTVNVYDFVFTNIGTAAANASINIGAPFNQVGFTLTNALWTNATGGASGGTLPSVAPITLNILATLPIGSSITLRLVGDYSTAGVVNGAVSISATGDNTPSNNSTAYSLTVTPSNTTAPQFPIGEWQMRVPALNESAEDLIGAPGTKFNVTPFTDPIFRNMLLARTDTWNGGVKVSPTRLVYRIGGHGDLTCNGVFGIDQVGAARIPRHLFVLEPLADQRVHLAPGDTVIWNTAQNRTVSTHAYRSRVMLKGQMLEYTHRATATASNQVLGVASLDATNSVYEPPVTCPDLNNFGYTLDARSPVVERQDQQRVFIRLGTAIIGRSNRGDVDDVTYHHFGMSTAIHHLVHRDAMETMYGINFSSMVFQSFPTNLPAAQRGVPNISNAAVAPVSIPITGDTTAFTSDFRVSSSVMVSTALNGIVVYDGYSGKVGLLTWAGVFSVLASTGSAYVSPTVAQRGTVVIGIRPPLFTNVSAEYGMYNAARIELQGAEEWLVVSLAPEQLGCDFAVRLT